MVLSRAVSKQNASDENMLAVDLEARAALTQNLFLGLKKKTKKSLVISCRTKLATAPSPTRCLFLSTITTSLLTRKETIRTP
jgi:hypothetical protein